MSDSYTVSLGNNDTETRVKANSDYVSFWNEQAKGLKWFEHWKKTLDWNPLLGI